MEFTLLRSCFAFPKFAFSLRTTDTCPHKGVRREFDEEVRKALEQILGAPLTDTQWDQASLPISQGGFGLRSATVLKPFLPPWWLHSRWCRR